MFRLLACLLLLFTTGCASKYAAGSWEYVQQERVERGLAPLEWDASLFPSVDERARSLAQNLTIAHDPEYTTVHMTGHAWICEVTGRQPQTDPGQKGAVLDAIGQGWVNSPEHAACVLGSTSTRAAVSAYVGADGWVYEVMWLTD